MVFRNDYGQRPDSVHPAATNLGLAFSDDGVKWQVQPKPCWQWRDDEVMRVYDPRLTVMDGRCAMCFAVDTLHGVCGGIAVTDDFERFEVLSVSVPDNRNMVLFPEKVGGNYVRLERPFPVSAGAAGTASTSGPPTRPICATGATRTWCSASRMCPTPMTRSAPARRRSRRRRVG